MSRSYRRWWRWTHRLVGPTGSCKSVPCLRCWQKTPTTGQATAVANGLARAAWETWESLRVFVPKINPSYLLTAFLNILLLFRQIESGQHGFSPHLVFPGRILRCSHSQFGFCLLWRSNSVVQAWYYHLIFVSSRTKLKQSIHQNYLCLCVSSFANNKCSSRSKWTEQSQKWLPSDSMRQPLVISHVGITWSL